MTPRPTLAELWCLANADARLPDEIEKTISFRDEHARRHGFFLAIDYLAHADGLSLWKERLAAGLDPATGEPKGGQS